MTWGTISIEKIVGFAHRQIKSYTPIRKSEDPVDELEYSLNTLMPENPNKPCDVKELITKVVDDRDF